MEDSMENFIDAPVIEPFRRLLRSRRFTTAIVAVLVSIAVSLIPGLEEVNTELFVVISTVALTLIGGYSWQDATATAKARDTLAGAELRDSIIEAVIAGITEIEFVLEDEPIDEEAPVQLPLE
jgi:hypothetical protein